MTTPVAFIIFNRPDTTEKVFAQIRRAQPPKLYIIADGPRTSEEKALTDATRAVAEQVDWPCKVKPLYSEENLGCRKRVITGLNAVFSQEEQAIILEDDCLPHPDFFKYCETLLSYYKDEDAIGTINGTCLPGTADHLTESSYTFSQFSIVWGWATTQKVWKLVDDDLKGWEGLKNKNWLTQLFPNQKDIVYSLKNMFNESVKGANAWSYSLLFALLKNEKLNIYPNVNLISNIGFDERATNTLDKKEYSNLPIENTWDCVHPSKIMLDYKANRNIYLILYHWYLGKKTGLRYFLKFTYKKIYKVKQRILPSFSFKTFFKRVFIPKIQ
jgi:hypothetical protein